MPELRSREEFFLGGVVPAPAQPDDCSICTESLETDVIKILACGHTFHLVCILAWFQSSSARHRSCPNCRRELFGPEPQPMPAVDAEPILPPEDDTESILALEPLLPLASEDEAESIPTLEDAADRASWESRIAQRDADLFDAIYEYRQSGAVPPHPAWYVSAERELALANALRTRARSGNPEREQQMANAVYEYRRAATLVRGR